MSLIDRNDFQVLRGGVPNSYQGCHDENIEMKDGTAVVAGDIVMIDAASGKFVKADLADAAVNHVALFTITEGNSDTFSGAFVEKATGITGRYKVQTKNFEPTGMAVGALVSLVAGVLTVDAAKPAVGQVAEYDAAAGIIKLYML